MQGFSGTLCSVHLLRLLLHDLFFSRRCLEWFVLSNVPLLLTENKETEVV